MTAVHGPMRSVARTPAARLLIGTVLGLLLMWSAYTAALLLLGTIAERELSGIEIDSGDLDARPGTAAAAVTTYLRSHLATFGWGTGTDSLSIRIDQLAGEAGTACFEVLAGDRLFLVTVDGGAGGSHVSAVAENLGPGRWQMLRGGDVLVCGG